MKRLFLKCLTFGLLTGALAMAQRTPPDPAKMVQHRVARMTETLGLTSSQQSQATALFTAAETADQATMANLKTAHTSLAAAIKANDLNSIGTLSSQIGVLEGQLTASRAKTEASFYSTLTADQQAKYHVGGAGGFAGARRPGGGPPR